MQFEFEQLTFEGPREAKTEVKYIYNEIFNEKCYLQHGIDIQPGDTIVDLGANLGIFSLFLSFFCGPEFLLCFFQVFGQFVLFLDIVFQ